MKMKMRILKKNQFLFWGIVGAVLVTAIVLFVAIFFAHVTNVGDRTPISQNAATKSIGLPVRLEIPEIKVNAVIEDVGLTPQGAMAVPEGPVDVAWLDLGPLPGEAGSAVIAGHEGWKDGIAAVFDNLHALRVGDKIVVEDNNGATVTFIVRDIKTYDQNGDTSGVFNTSDGQAHLNLITCEGTWNVVKKSYSDRLVVFADKEAN
jgi:LPXTG-site transpeptidase (sortase) family protein